MTNTPTCACGQQVLMRSGEEQALEELEINDEKHNPMVCTKAGQVIGRRQISFEGYMCPDCFVHDPRKSSPHCELCTMLLGVCGLEREPSDA